MLKKIITFLFAHNKNFITFVMLKKVNVMEGKGYVYLGCWKIPCKIAGDKVTLHKSDINRALKALENAKATIDKTGGEYCNTRLLEMELVEDRIYYNGMIDVLRDLAYCFKR